MDRLEDLSNRLMDNDTLWWPFLYLRPAREQPMTTGFVAKMALHFGPLIGVLMAGIAVVKPQEASATEITVISMVIATASFFAFYRLTFAFFWNRRAARMKPR